MTAIHTRHKGSIRSIEVPTTSPGVVRTLVYMDTSDIPAARRPMLSALYAEMLLTGTAHMSKKVLNERIDAIGATIDVSAGAETIMLSCTSTTERLTDMLALVRAIMTTPAFSPSELALIKKKAHQLLHDEKDDAKMQSYAHFARAIYKNGHPYRTATTAERVRDLDAVMRKDLQALHARVRTAPWTIGISATRPYAETAYKALSRLNQGKRPAEKPAHRVTNAVSKTETSVTVPGKVNIEVCLGNALPLVMTDRMYLAFSLGIDILGKRGGFVGRLMSTVREKEGLTYGIYAWLSGATRTTTGHWNIRTFFTAKDYRKGIASTLRELRSIRDKGVAGEELVRMKEILENQFRMAHGSSGGLLGLYVPAYDMGIEPHEVEARMQTLAELTTEEVNAALRTHIDPDNLVLSSAGPINTKGMPLEKVPAHGTMTT